MSDGETTGVDSGETMNRVGVLGPFSSWTHRVVGTTLVVAGVLVAVVGLGLLLGVTGSDIGRVVGTVAAVVGGGAFALVTVFVPRWIASD